MRNWLLVLCCWPVYSFAQDTVSAETILAKMNKLYMEGKLDSIVCEVNFLYENKPTHDSTIQFYIYTDTFYLNNGLYAVGKLILDPLMDFHAEQIGNWEYYYPSGQLLARGVFGIIASYECNGTAPSTVGYSYKKNNWEYFYKNGKLRAKGNYIIPGKKNIISSSGPVYLFPQQDDTWVYYDLAGLQSKKGDIEQTKKWISDVVKWE